MLGRFLKASSVALLLAYSFVSLASDEDAVSIEDKIEVVQGPDLVVEGLTFVIPELVQRGFEFIPVNAFYKIEKSLEENLDLPFVVNPYEYYASGELDLEKQTLLGKFKYPENDEAGGIGFFLFNSPLDTGLKTWNTVVWWGVVALMGYTGFRLTWISMTVEDSNMTLKKLIMLGPSLAIVTFLIFPLDHGFTSGQVVLMAAFLMSNYIGAHIAFASAAVMPFLSFNGGELTEDPWKASIERSIRHTAFEVDRISEDMLVSTMAFDHHFAKTLNIQAKPVSIGLLEEIRANLSEKFKYNIPAGCLYGSGWEKELVSNPACEALTYGEEFFKSGVAVYPKTSEEEVKQAGYTSDYASAILGYKPLFDDAVDSRYQDMVYMACSYDDGTFVEHERTDSLLCFNKVIPQGMTGDYESDLEVFLSRSASSLDFSEPTKLPRIYGELMSEFSKRAEYIYNDKISSLNIEFVSRGLLSAPFSFLIITGKMREFIDSLDSQISEKIGPIIKFSNPIFSGGNLVVLNNRAEFLDLINDYNSFYGCKVSPSFSYCDGELFGAGSDYPLYRTYEVIRFHSEIIEGARASLPGKNEGFMQIPSVIELRGNELTCAKDVTTCTDKISNPFEATSGYGRTFMASGFTFFILGKILSQYESYQVEKGIAPHPLVRGKSDGLIYFGGMAMAVGVLANVVGIFMFMSYALKIFFPCVFRLFTNVFHLPILAIKYLYERFDEESLDDANSSTPHTVLLILLRTLIDMVSVAFAIIISLVITFVLMGLINIVVSSTFLSIISGGVSSLSDLMMFFFYQGIKVFMLMWMMYHCAKLIPYCYEKLTDMIDDASGIKVDQSHEMITMAKSILSPSLIFR
ncbi:hypothetical protein [Vibrio alginolyticus]|uniref:hypothetical protein n=1 Tax=Vibrio alginolyticus TaxID=663 RepID=UPI0006CA88E0|nr:hypothetical protein [Vibrio alginolyticus]KPM98738.1 hypothetical protein AOG25_10075 [Vibrio alginolyticus]CAH7176049.1 conserved membrane hypothetical protein [Vibrio chagasii]CAH7345007.1 conserved membrane hypothetical protein [Vibrio chagasii]